MRKRDHFRAWVNHAALNLGVALECLVHVALPPQFDHDIETVTALSKSDLITEFKTGLGHGPDSL